MYLSDSWLAAFDTAYAPRSVKSVSLPVESHRGHVGGVGSITAKGDLLYTGIKHVVFGKSALHANKKFVPVGSLPAGHQVDKIHGFLSKTNLSALCQSTGFSRSQLLSFWLQYKSLCMLSASPLGVDYNAFHRFVPTVTLEDSLFVERVFRVLDRAGSTQISWPDFLEAMSCLGAGARSKRAAFLFSVYDIESKGNLGPSDLFQFFASSLSIPVPPDYDPVATLAHAEAGAAEGCSPLEGLKGSNDAKLLCCAIFMHKAFVLLDPEKKGFVTLEAVLSSDGEVSKVFGRSMLSSLESETKDIMSGSHRSAQDAAAGERVALLKAHKLLMEETTMLHSGDAEVKFC